MSKAQYDVTILVPVYNEKNTIKRILSSVTSIQGINYELIIVDDFSNDGSREILQDWYKLNKKQSIKLILHAQNKGKGAGIKTAVKEARGKYFVVQDADLEYDPSEIPGIAQKAFLENAQAVYGSRFKGKVKNMPKANYVANRMYNLMLIPLYGKRVSDMHTCYKMVDTGLLRDMEIQSDGFEYATEFISKLLKRGVTIYEVPISFNGRTIKEGKKIDIKDGLICFRDLVHYRFSKKIE